LERIKRGSSEKEGNPARLKKGTLFVTISLKFRFKHMKKILFLFLLAFQLTLESQNLNHEKREFFEKKQDSLKILQKKIYTTKTDSLVFKFNKQFIQAFETVLYNQASIDFEFDSLKDCSRLRSADGKIRIITWNIYKNDETYFYFGFVQVRTSNGCETYKLIDKSTGIKSPELHSANCDKWFGMLYYNIIDCGDYYTLLGWDGNDKLIKRKFIDVLYLKNNEPFFGKDIFEINNKNPKRLMFEYSSEVSMSLKYYPELKRIVFDHLAPKDALLEGQYQYYGPDFSVDALKFSKGKWKFEKDYDIKNDKNKNDNIVVDPNKKDKPIYTPK
jgi:hypothetical protein